MGAWGPGIFDNDDAGDFLSALERSGAPAVDEVLTAAIREAEEGFVEAPAGSSALAAADVVATAFGAPSPSMTDTQAAMIARHADAIRELPDVRARAAQAAKAALGGAGDGTLVSSELMDLWLMDGVSEADRAAVEAAFTDLETRLARVLEEQAR